MTETEIAEVLRRLGSRNPHELARYAVEQNSPEVARHRVLRGIWTHLASLQSSEAMLEAAPAGRRLLAAGASRTDVMAFATLAAYEMAFGILFGSSEAFLPPDVEESWPALPGVVLAEVDEGGRLTGRILGGLHESLLSADPSGDHGAAFMT